MLLSAQMPGSQSASPAQAMSVRLQRSCCVHLLADAAARAGGGAAAAGLGRAVAVDKAGVAGGAAAGDGLAVAVGRAGGEAASCRCWSGSAGRWRRTWRRRRSTPIDRPPRHMRPSSQSTPTSLSVSKVPPGTPVIEPEVSNRISMFGLWICRTIMLRGSMRAYVVRGATAEKQVGQEERRHHLGAPPRTCCECSWAVASSMNVPGVPWRSPPVAIRRPAGAGIRRPFREKSARDDVNGDVYQRQ